MTGKMAQGMDFALLNHDADLFLAVVRTARTVAPKTGALISGERVVRLHERRTVHQAPPVPAGK
jgi:hypothetical protein